MTCNSSKKAGVNGAYIEELILRQPPNPTNFIDDEKNRTEIKSCQDYVLYYHHNRLEKRAGYFKINIHQHNYLLEINGFYLFVVHNTEIKEITFCKIIRAYHIETMFKFLNRKIPKHNCFNLNWKKLE